MKWHRSYAKYPTAPHVNGTDSKLSSRWKLLNRCRSSSKGFPVFLVILWRLCFKILLPFDMTVRKGSYPMNEYLPIFSLLLALSRKKFFEWVWVWWKIFNKSVHGSNSLIINFFLVLPTKFAIKIIKKKYYKTTKDCEGL